MLAHIASRSSSSRRAPLGFAVLRGVRALVLLHTVSERPQQLWH
jgi:hypothetical protein